MNTPTHPIKEAEILVGGLIHQLTESGQTAKSIDCFPGDLREELIEVQSLLTSWMAGQGFDSVGNEPNRTVIIVSTAGDKAAGIGRGYCEIKFDFDIEAEALATRDEFRRVFQAFFDEHDLLGAPVGVRFADECPDCGRKMVCAVGSGVAETILICPNANCLSNQPLCPE